MRHKRSIGAGVAAVALTAVLAGPAQAADSVTVAAEGPPSGFALFCPQGMRPTVWTMTNPDGTPLDNRQRVRWTFDSGQGGKEAGIATWIAPYQDSPPPPPVYRLTVTCSC